MAVQKQDLEVIVDSIVTLLKAKLPSKLTSITSEKGDSTSLPAIDPAAYVIFTLNKQPVIYDPFLFVFPIDLRTEGRRGLSAHTVSLSVLTIKSDAGENLGIDRTMLRYMRALEEVFEENFDDLGTGAKYIIESLAPKQIGDLNSGKQFKAAGVALTFSYT